LLCARERERERNREIFFFPLSLSFCDKDAKFFCMTDR
jgi:hypothetical protein